jgi:hypothetical protein
MEDEITSTRKGMEDNEMEWKTTKWNGRQQTGIENNGMMEGETDARCSACISNIVLLLQ